jgi:Zn-dependent protease with chaperone function
LAGDDCLAFFGFTPTLEISHSPRPYAFVTDLGTIHVSSGMLAQVQNESQLAFLLAHEIAHVLLGHHQHRDHSDSGQFLEQEIAADQMALSLIQQGGFEGADGEALLRRISEFGTDSGIALRQLFPGLDARLVALSRIPHTPPLVS